jgi:UDP-glucose 4-epimerase
MSIRTIGVTGASGFLGSSLLRRLEEDPAVRVVALTRTLGPSQAERSPNVEWRQVDLGSDDDCRAFVADVDVIVHLAHTNTPLTSNRSLPSDASVNTDPTLTLLQAIREVGTRPHLVYASSGGALYRPSVDGSPVDEDSTLEPLTSYGILKLAFEHYLRMAAHEEWLTATVLRIGNPYGVLLPTERLQGFIGVAMHQLLDDRPVRIFGDLDNIRDYVHLDDVCQAFLNALDASEPFGLYNIGSGCGTSVREVLEILGRVTGAEVPIEHDEIPGDAARLPRWIVLDASKAESTFGWRAEVRLEDGIRARWEGGRR